MPLLRTILLALLTIVCLTGLAQAQTTGNVSGNGFTVRNVQVDVTAANVSAARDQAFVEAQRQAFQTLLARLVLPADLARAPKLQESALEDVVLDIGVDQEKRSSVRYIATLSVRFKPDAVRQLLQSADIPYTEWRGRPLVVLPVWQTAAGPVLLDGTNPWRDAWRGPAAQGVVPITVPSAPANAASLDSSSLPDAVQAAAGGPSVLADFAQRLNADDLLIATASETREDKGKLNIDVTLSGTGPTGGGLNGTRSYAGDTGESEETVLNRAVTDIANSLNDSYKSGNVLRFGQGTSTLSVMVPLGGLPAWMAVRDKLTRSTPVRSYDVAAISKEEASLVLHYVGEQSQLESVFMQNGLVLTWTGDHWELRNVVTHPGASSASKPEKH